MKLEIIGLTKKYGEKLVLDDIDFTFEVGKIYGLIGRNGAGKTTFFNSLNADIDIDGRVFYLENNVYASELSDESKKMLDKFYKMQYYWIYDKK